MRKPLAVVAFLAAVGGIQAQAVRGTWVGSFEAPGLWGGLELIFDQKGDAWSAQARVQVSGRLHSESVDQVSIGQNTISFRTKWEGREVRVSGTVVGTRLRGSVTMAGTSPDHFVSGRLDLVRLSTSPSDILPPPTGSFAIGRSTFRWVDEKRDEPSTTDPSDKRELSVYLWYPTKHRSHSPYLTDAERVAPFLPKGTGEISTKLELAVSADAPILKGRRYPVVVFSPGKGVNAFHYSSLYQDLASRGFVVAAVDHPYDAPVVVFPEGRAVLPLPKEARPAQKGSDLEVQQQAADFRARDILSVKEALARMNADPDGAFVGSFDLSKLFAAGHSLGGMAAFRACQLEPSILACINIDGGYRARPYPATVNESVIEPSFLWLRRPLYEFTDTQLKQVGMTRPEFDEEISMGSRVMRSVGKGGFDVRLPHAGIEHMDFSDLPLLHSDISPSSRATHSLTIEMMRSWVRDFLEAAAEGQPRRVLTQTSAPYREARITAYK
jgi:predicted dienelactone hydrolase